MGVFCNLCSNIVPENRDDSTGNGSTWPIPMPYPEAFRASGSVPLWRKKRTCLQVLVLNWCWLGGPSKCPDSLWLGRRLSARQWKVIFSLENLAEDANSVGEVSAVDIGRTAGKVELQDNDIAAIHRACDSLHSYSNSAGLSRARVHVEPGDDGSALKGAFGSVVGVAPKSSYIAAKPIVADRLMFSGEPKFDPAEFLDVRTAEMYENPQHFSDYKTALPPVGRVRGSRQEVLKLFRKLAATKRLVPLASELVDPRFTSGLFSVGKDMERDRLIMDSRPPNAAEEGLNKWTQCAANAFNVSQLEIRPDEVLLMSGQDVKDFYYQFRIGPKRAARNALSCFLSYDELVSIFGAADWLPSSGGYVGLNTLAMGDICACEFAQGSHLGLLLQSMTAYPRELLRYRAPSPRSLFTVGIVIDDLVMLERVLKSAEQVETISDERMKRAEAAYNRAGLPTNPKKAFHKQTSASFWGISVDALKGTMRPNPQRLWPLELITWRVIALGVVTISLLESLIGSWVSVFMQRRRMLSVLDLAFKAIHSGAAPEHVLRMAPGLKDELVLCCVMGTMTVCNLRAGTLAVIKATDASDWGMAAVEAVVPTSVCREAARYSLSKSLWTKLLPPSKAWLKTKQLIAAADELPGETFYDTHPFWVVLANFPSYNELWRRPYERPCHINIGELTAHLKEEARVGTKFPSSRCCYGLDSQVALGALVKGRSASAGLNALLRKSLAIQLGYDLYSHLGYFPSAINRSDGPTRGVVPLPPTIPEPDFWRPLVEGDYTLFEEWLDAQGAPDTVSKTDEEFKPLGAHGFSADVSSGRCDASLELEKKEIDGSSVFADTGGDGESGEGSLLSTEAVRLLNVIPSKFVWWPKGSSRKFLRPGALDLYSGTAGVARYLLTHGAPFVVVVDWKMGSEADLLQVEVQNLVLDLIRAGAFAVSGSAVICSSFSKAITPGVRSPRYPRGLPGMRRSMRLRVTQGNQHADFNARLILVAEDNDVWWWLENPDSSYLWIQRGYGRFRRPDSDWLYRVDFCRFKARWRKRTRVATSLPTLRGRRLLCRCNPPNHIQLRGQHPILRKPWTAVAEPYPRGFAASIGRAICIATGWRAELADVSKTGGGRIGEAENPGPRRGSAARRGSLESRPVQGSNTILLGERCWEKFLCWCDRTMVETNPLELFLAVPLFLAHAIRKFGDVEFQRGGSLLYYRHLVLVAQRKVPNLKPMAHICWDLATRWELAEPTQHRTPMPLPLLEAMVILAWHLKWYRWSAIAVACFFGVARVGEVLAATRRDLLLPMDLLDDDHAAAYLVLWKSKTSRRQPSRVQHLKIIAPSAVNLLQEVYSGVSGSEKLYHGSPSMFRHRWNLLLKWLCIPAEFRLTPAGLRGGGAIELYRGGEAIGNIQWRMRIRQQVTLEAYLQEVAAVSLLPDLPVSTADRIRAFSKLFRIRF